MLQSIVTLHGSRKLPSYAPQNSPAEPKVTVDYKQLLRGCKSYKDPGKQTKGKNLFNNQKVLNVGLNQLDDKTSLSSEQHPSESKSIIAPPKLYNTHVLENSTHQEKSTFKVVKKSLFEKLSASITSTIKVPSEENILYTTETKKPKKSLSKQDEADESDAKKYPTYSNKSPANYNSIEEGSNLIYTPGVGITLPPSSSENASSPSKTVTKSFISSSLDFYDPYNNSVPMATSPGKSNAPLDETFELHYDQEEVPSSQESNNTSLIIEDNDTNSDSDVGKHISGSDDEQIRQISDEKQDFSASNSNIQDNSKSEENYIKNYSSSNEIRSSANKSQDKGTLKIPTYLNLNDEQSKVGLDESRNNVVFGTFSVSPVKVKKTFSKKKAHDVVTIDLIEVEEEDKIMEEEFKKNMNKEEAILIEEPPIKADITSSSQGSADECENSKSTFDIMLPEKDCDKNVSHKLNRKKNREQKLEEIKNLKARIFEKQWKQSKHDSSSTSSNSSTDSESSDSGTGESSVSSYLNASKNIKNKSDSDFSINSNESVESGSEVLNSNDHSSPNYSVSGSSPKRKRKKLSSPIYCTQETQKMKSLKPVLSLTPQQLKEKKLRYARENKKLLTNVQIPEIQPPLRKHKKHKIAHESTPECKLKKENIIETINLETKHTKSSKQSKDLENKRQHRFNNEKEIHAQSKQRHISSNLNQGEHQKESKNDTKCETVQSLPRIPRKSKLKPGVSANIKSDQIIPHQRKLSERKLKIMAKYDKRMDSGKIPVDNTKTFYQKTDSSELSNIMSKYKKEVCIFFTKSLFNLSMRTCVQIMFKCWLLTSPYFFITSFFPCKYVFIDIIL